MLPGGKGLATTVAVSAYYSKAVETPRCHFAIMRMSVAIFVSRGAWRTLRRHHRRDGNFSTMFVGGGYHDIMRRRPWRAVFLRHRCSGGARHRHRVASASMRLRNFALEIVSETRRTGSTVSYRATGR